MPMTMQGMDIDQILQIGLAQLAAQQLDCQKYQTYYTGPHPRAFATKRFNSDFGKLLEKFADNLCPSVVDSVADRLKVIGFTTEDEAQKSAAAEAWNIWTA